MSGLDNLIIGFCLGNTAGIIVVVFMILGIFGRLKKMQDNMTYIHRRAKKTERLEELRIEQEEKRHEAIAARKKKAQ